MTNILIRAANSTNTVDTENRCYQDSRLQKNKSDEPASYLSTTNTGNTLAQNQIDVATLSDMELKSEECSVTRQRRKKAETKPLYSPEKYLDGESSNFELSKSQKHWLSIGEKFGTWLLKQKARI